MTPSEWIGLILQVVATGAAAAAAFAAWRSVVSVSRERKGREITGAVGGPQRLASSDVVPS
jgi:hypothetical protein